MPTVSGLSTLPKTGETGSSATTKRKPVMVFYYTKMPINSLIEAFHLLGGVLRQLVPS